MMGVWADDDDIVCVHPMGPRLEGRKAVESSWRQIFAGDTLMQFEITHVHRAHSENLSVHCVYEVITYGPRLQQQSRVIATNVFRLTRAGWRMIVHHGSPGTEPEREEESRDPPAILH